MSCSLWKSSILVACELLALKIAKAFVGSRTTLEDLPFSHKILKMNSCTFVLNGETPCLEWRDLWSYIKTRKRPQNAHQKLKYSK